MRLSVHRSLPVAGAFLLASTLLAGCEVNLNTEGLSARETKSFKVAGLRVVVPRTSNIVARSGDGSIRAEALDGKIVLNTTDGSVTATRLSGDIQVRSGDGSIRLDQVTGKLDLETDDGSIGFEGRPSVLHLKTGDGSVRAQIDVDTVMAENWDLTTGDGSITLTLPAAFNAELNAETSDGTVRSLAPAARERARRAAQRRRQRRATRAPPRNADAHGRWRQDPARTHR